MEDESQAEPERAVDEQVGLLVEPVAVIGQVELPLPAGMARLVATAEPVTMGAGRVAPADWYGPVGGDG